MKRQYARIFNIVLLAVTALFTAGCQGGGVAGFLGSTIGAIASSGSGGGSAGGGVAGSTGGFLLASSGGGIPPTVHHPEPGTMLLLGGGLVAMTLVKNLNNKKR